MAIVEVIAGAIRRDPDRAHPLDRAFRAVARGVLAAGGGPGAALGVVTSAALLAVAARLLRAEGKDDNQGRLLVQEEVGSPDDWLAFLILSSRPQVESLLDPDRP